MAIAFVYLIIINLLVSIYFPFFPIDETRYISVAWGMHLSHNWFHQTVAGAPYFHKPPLLFWLVNLFWKVFSVHFHWLRLIPLIFSLVSILLCKKIYELLYLEAEGFSNFAFLLVTSFGWLVFSFLMMFDGILTCFVLAVIYITLKAYKCKQNLPSLLLFVVFTLGLLSKGPVFLVHCLPGIIILLILGKKRDWLLPLFFSLGGAIVVSLTWLVVALHETNASASPITILRYQSLNRVIHPYAHKNSFLYLIISYLAFFLPWSGLADFWKELQFGLLSRRSNSWYLNLFIWPAFLFFSIIPTRQPQYLLPELPLVLLVVAHPKTRLLIKENIQRWVYVGFILLFFLLGVGGRHFIKEYDTTRIGKYISKIMNEHKNIVVAGKYFGEFDYSGFLPKQLVSCENQCVDWAKRHPNGIILLNLKDKKEQILFSKCMKKSFNYKVNRKIIFVGSKCYLKIKSF